METTLEPPKQAPMRNAPPVATVIGKVLSQQLTGSSKPLSTESSEKPEKLRQALLDLLWTKMAEMYGHRWTSNFGITADPESVWGKVLAGLNGQHLANGLNALVERGQEFDWPPPANVFRSLCLQVSGLPSDDEAWEQALRGEYKHKAVEIAAKATGTFDLRTAKLDNKALRKVFDRNYAIVKARAAMGKPLEGEILMAIGHEAKTPQQVQDEHSIARARQIAEALGVPSNATAARQMLQEQLGKMRRKSPEVRRDA